MPAFSEVDGEFAFFDCIWPCAARFTTDAGVLQIPFWAMSVPYLCKGVAWVENRRAVHVHLCPFMLQYGWYFDNSKDFGGVKIWNMSIYVYLCCCMGDMLIIQRILVGWQFEHVHLCPFMLQYGWHFDNSKDFGGVKIWNMSIYVHLCCRMGDMLIIQMGRKHMSTKWGHILSRVAFEFNCIIGKTRILCERSGL